MRLDAFVQNLFAVSVVAAIVVVLYMFACAVAEKSVPVEAVYLLVACLVIVMITLFVFPTALLAGLI